MTFPQITELNFLTTDIMRKIVLAAIAVLALAACSSKKAGVWSDLSGEWDVLTIRGEQVVFDTLTMQQPYIGFEINGRVYGCAGCNRIMGEIASEKPKVADFSKIATTMMACPDMTLETEMLDALGKVTRFYYTDGTRRNIEFADSEGNVLMTLSKRWI